MCNREDAEPCEPPQAEPAVPETTEKETVRAICDELEKSGEALKGIAIALRGLSREGAIRVIRASAILHGVDLRALGLREDR